MLRRIPSWVTDLATSGIVGLITIADALHDGRVLWLTLPLTALGSLALLLRRRQPLLVLALETAFATTLAAAGRFLLIAGVIVAIWSVAARLERAVSLRATGLAGAVLAFVTVTRNDWHGVVPEVAFVAAAWLAGDARHSAEAEREERAHQAVADERARIARELHDVITHNVSVMVVQAAAGHDVFDSRPERARDALRAIDETGRRALGELRRLLDVEGGADGNLPQPGLARVDELLANVRAAGLPVALEIEGSRPAVPEGVDLSAYRILQEALTNTLKHAHASRASVRVRYAANAVELEVLDDGVGGSTAGEGRGIVGMRERVALFGGELDAGSRSEGGFAVRARMPLGAT